LIKFEKRLVFIMKALITKCLNTVQTAITFFEGLNKI